MEEAVAAGVAIVLALIAGLAVRRRVGFVTVVDSSSMAPALAPGQHVLTRRLTSSRPPRRGDIVVVDSDELQRVIVKRVVGLPGEHVVIDGDGRVLVDRRILAEPYVVDPGGPSGTFDVEAGHLLLLGDNRVHSSDSRNWRRPYLPITKVRGRVIAPVSPRSLAEVESSPGSRRRGPAPAG